MNNQYSSRKIQTIVIGGGQAGLAVGYHLAKRGISFLILDASQRIGDAWRNRWDSLRLFNPARYAGLPWISVSRSGRRISHQGGDGGLPRILCAALSTCRCGPA